MVSRVVHHRTGGVDWYKLQDAAFSVLFWIVAIGFIILLSISIWNAFAVDNPRNAIENSNFWAGYSEVEVYQIFDRKTGVIYAVTETGDMCVIVDAEGNPRLVD